jgi:Zn-dependent protease with chaperone function
MEDNNLTGRIYTLESFAATKPGQYRFRVALLASLGYAYLLFIVALLLALVAATFIYVGFNIVTIKVLWIPLVLAGLVLRSLWVTIPEPDGKELRQDEAPALFELIGEVSKVLSGPKVHRILISDEFDASIVQIPQFGMFGWLRNYLVIGLPLMRALSPAEFRAVLAHDFGCLSEKHGRFSGWIYRVRQTWTQVLTQVREDRRYASFMFAPFLEWYAPYLNAYSFLLVRAQEREGDTYAVDVAGKNVTAQALTRITLKQRALVEDFWPTFLRGAKEQPLAPRDTFTQMLDGLDQSISRAKAQRWIREALRTPTGYVYPDLALGDRLRAIGFDKDGPDLMRLIDALVKSDNGQESAASRYLRELPEDFVASMNRVWRERIAQHWRERHQEIKKAGKRLAELDDQTETRDLTVEEQWERALALAETNDQTAVLPAIKALLDETPDHVEANFVAGKILLDQGDADGIPYLEKTIQSGPEVAGEACQLISGFYLEQGYDEIAETFRKHAEKYFAKAFQLQQQVLSFTAADQFVSHDLEESRVQELQTQLRKIRGLGTAFLFRKIIEDREQPAFYVLAVTAEYTWRDGQSEKNIDLLFEDLWAKVDLPSPVTLLSLDGEHAYLSDRIKRIPGAVIFGTPAERA